MSRVQIPTILAAGSLFTITFAGLPASAQHGGGGTAVASRATLLAFEELPRLSIRGRSKSCRMAGS